MGQFLVKNCDKVEFWIYLVKIELPAPEASARW